MSIFTMKNRDIVSENLTDYLSTWCHFVDVVDRSFQDSQFQYFTLNIIHVNNFIDNTSSNYRYSRSEEQLFHQEFLADMHPVEMSQLFYRVLPNLEITFSDPKTLKLLPFLGSDLLDGRPSALLLYCNTRLFFTDMLPFKLELAIRLLEVSPDWPSDILNCSAHYTFSPLLMAI